MTAKLLAGLIPGIASQTNLQTLYLCMIYIIIGKDSIDDKGLEIIVGGIKENTNLGELILEENNIGNDGMTHLAKLLPSLQNLTLLHLGKNNIDDAGIENLKVALKLSSVLRFHISQNKFKSAGAQALFKSLPENLMLLNASDNTINDADADVLIAHIKENYRTFRVLYLDGVKINVEKGKDIINKVSNLKPSLDGPRYLFLSKFELNVGRDGLTKKAINGLVKKDCNVIVE